MSIPGKTCLECLRATKVILTCQGSSELSPGESASEPFAVSVSFAGKQFFLAFVTESTRKLSTQPISALLQWPHVYSWVDTVAFSANTWAICLLIPISFHLGRDLFRWASSRCGAHVPQLSLGLCPNGHAVEGQVSIVLSDHVLGHWPPLGVSTSP